MTSRSHFLLTPLEPGALFTTEDLNAEQRSLADTASEFWNNEIRPNIDGILEQRPGLIRRLMRKGAGIGLMALSVPESYGGIGLDLISALAVAEQNARDGSYMVWEGGHTTIGTLPIVYFGNETQKRKYLPRLATLDLLAAYALSESQAGSDALAIQTRAVLSPDRRHYVLSGQKMWITNAAEADLFTVFAKVDGELFTAFLVERSFEGLRVGAEEHKMGLRGSSTTALYLDDVHVPVENVLGEIGRGHRVAFNILNIGRLKMGASSIGAAKEVLRLSIAYARERRAFGSPISEFGAIQHKLAEMAVRIFATEAIVWRTAGLIDRADGGVTWDDPDAARKKLAAVREFAAECSMVKVFSTEMLDFTVDEGVQIHGGYGYHEDYAVERAYRDSRINRIFEGTNEINRLLIARMLLKRGADEDSPLFSTAAAVLSDSDTGRNLNDRVSLAKWMALLSLGIAREAWPGTLPNEQEVLMLLADIVIDVYAMESTLGRSQKLQHSSRAELARHMATVFADEAMMKIYTNARRIVGAASREGKNVLANPGLDAMLQEAPNLVAARRHIARRAVERGAYPL